MGNQCCAAGGGSGEALEHYLGIPVSTLCTYEAHLLGMAAPSAADAFHVAMVDALGEGGSAARSVPSTAAASSKAPAAPGTASSTHIAFRERNERHHDVPLLVEAACRLLAATCPTTTTGAFKAPSVARLATSQTQPWVDLVRVDIDRTFVSSTEQWIIWHKASRKASKQHTKGSHRAAGVDDPLTRILAINEGNTVRCLALLSYFFRHLPAPLLPPVMLTELEHELHPGLPIEERRTCFLRVWHGVFASSYPIEYAIIEHIATVLHQLARRGHPGGSDRGAQAAAAPRQRTTVCVDDGWRDALDVFLRQSWWIRSFSGRAGATAQAADHRGGAPHSEADSAQELLYDTIADAVFMIRRHPGREDGGGRRERSVSPPHTASPSGGKTQPQLGMVDVSEGPRGEQEGSATASGSAAHQLAAQSSSEPFDGASAARESADARRVVATAPAHTDSHPRSAPQHDADHHHHHHHQNQTQRAAAAALSAPTTSAAAAAHSSMVPSNSFSSADSDDDGSAGPRVATTVASPEDGVAAGCGRDDTSAVGAASSSGPKHEGVPELDGGAVPMGPRSRQSSVAVSAVSLTPWQPGMDPNDAAQHKHLPPLDVHEAPRSASGGGASDASRRLMLAKASFRGVGVGEDDASLQRVMETSAQARHASHRDCSVPQHVDLDASAMGPTVQAFMLESTEAFSALRLEMEELRRQQHRTSTLCEEGLAHRSFREHTQATMSELAESVADVGEGLLQMKQKVRDLEEALRQSNVDRDGLAAEAAAARFSASEVVMRFADVERSLLHHEQAIKYTDRRLVEVDDDQTKVGSTIRMLRVDLDALQRRFLLFRDQI